MKHSTTTRIVSLAAFLILMLGGGIAVGLATAPDAWYAALTKPPFNPPNWIFGPVWTILYIIVAIAGWRIWLRARRSWAMKTWWLQLALNFLWSPVFFTAHRLDLALLVVVPLFLSIVLFIITAWRRDRTAALLFIPYLLWVAFATVLNASLLYLNS